MGKLFELEVQDSTVGVVLTSPSTLAMPKTMLNLARFSPSPRWLGLISGVMLLAACAREPAGSSRMPALPVQVVTLAPAEIMDSSEFVATLRAKQRATVRSEIAGRIVGLGVGDGDRVEPGQLLLQINPDQTLAQVQASTASVNAQKASEVGAEAAVRTARAQLQAAEANRDNARAALKRQEAELANTQANLALQNEELKRVSFLVSEGVQSQQQLDVQQTSRDSAIATRTAATEAVNAAQSALRAAEANVTIAREQLAAALAGLEGHRATVARAQAELAATSETFRFTRVTAPFAGRIGNFAVRAGDYVSAGAVLTNLVQDDFFELNLAIPVARAADLRVGLAVELLDEASQETLGTGQISFVAPEVNAIAQTILAKASIRNNGNLRDGQFVRARVIWSRQTGLLIPTIAVSRVAGKEFVFVVERNTNPELPAEFALRQQAVTIGPVQGDSYPVLSGVTAREQIAVSNILKLRDGAPVEPEESTSNTTILPE